MITHAFTCTGPYAILIMLGLKRVENRSAKPVSEKGRVAITCAKSFCKEEYGNFIKWASTALSEEDFSLIPSWNDVKDWPGKVVGACDYHAKSAAEMRPFSWDEGYEWNYTLTNIVCFESPIPCRGNVGLWEMPKALSAAVSSADTLSSIPGTLVSTADDARKLFSAAVGIAGKSEGFFVLPLDADKRALSAPILVSLGDSVTTIVQPSEVFSAALDVGADSIIVAHNHPSGNLTPSLQDEQLTKVLKALGSAMSLPVLDHLILAGRG